MHLLSFRKLIITTIHDERRRATNLPVTKESCLGELQKGRFYVHGKVRPFMFTLYAARPPINPSAFIHDLDLVSTPPTQDKQGRPIAYYSLAVHDPKNRDLAEIMRMLAFQMEGVLAAMPEDGPQGITIVWDTRNTGLKNTDNEFLREFLQFFKAQVSRFLSHV